jgi:hypothetical protein
MDLKTRRPLLGSAARTASTATSRQKDPSGQKLRLYLHVTTASGTGGLQPQVRAYDSTGAAVAITTGGTPVTAAGVYVYELALSVGAASGNVKESVARVLPYEWDVQVVHGDGTSYTYSLDAEVAP